MRSREQIRKELDNIETEFYSDKNEPVKMNQFSSFLSCVNPLPRTNKEIIDTLKNKNLEVKPNNIREEFHPDYDFDYDEFFKGNIPFNDDTMFTGLNVAARPGERDYSDWKNFHDKDNNDHTTRLYTLVNDVRFQGSYVDDIIKSTVESSSEIVQNDFFVNAYTEELSFANDNESLDDKRIDRYLQLDKNKERFNGNRDKAEKAVKQNRDIFEKSTRIYAEELKVIQPKHLVFFGQAAYKLMQQMMNTEYFANEPELRSLLKNSIYTSHYAVQSNYEDWVKNQNKELIEKLESMDKEK